MNYFKTMNKPLITIDEFSGMGDNGLFWLENASVGKINGKSVITPIFYQSKYIGKGDTGFDDFSNVFNCITNFYMQKSSNSLHKFLVGIDTSKIFGFDLSFTSYNKGLMHSIANVGSGTDQIIYSNYPALFNTKENNLLYASANHLGLGIKGKCHADSNNVKIVDSEGRDFTTLGVSTSYGSNKVYNTRSKEEYTITSITTTNSTNDTLNFTAGTGDNNENEEFILFIDNKFKFETFASGENHFVGQEGAIYWKRQILLWGDYYWILNGNWLSNLNIDEATWEEEAKQLPYNCQAVCFSINAEKMLVGCEINGKGKLILWDSYSDGWLNEINLEKAPISIKPYKQGWIVSVGASLYYTDGYSWEFIADYPDTNKYYKFNGNFDAMVIIDDLIFHNLYSLTNRFKSGVGVYDMKKGWSYLPMKSIDGEFAYKGTQGSLFVYTDTSGRAIPITSCSVNNITNGVSINKIYFSGSLKYNMIYYLKLPKVMNISRIRLNVMAKINYYTRSGQTVNLTVAYGDGKDNIMNYFRCKDSGNTTTKIINGLGANYPAKVGDEIFAVEGKCCGERTFITAIENAGTNNEELTVSPALSEIITDTLDFSRLSLKKAGNTRTFDPTNIPEDLNFEVKNFLSDKIFIEIVVDASSVRLDIHSIDLF